MLLYSEYISVILHEEDCWLFCNTRQDKIYP